MLGGVADAEDMLQEAFVRWQQKVHLGQAGRIAINSRIVARRKLAPTRDLELAKLISGPKATCHGRWRG